MPSYSFVTDPGMVKELLLERESRNSGGVECLICGTQGSGKTTAISQVAIENKKNFDDVIVVRSSEDCQWSYFIDSKIKMDLLLKEGLDMKLFDRKTGKNIEIDSIFNKIKTYDSGSVLVNKLSHKNFNIVQTTPYAIGNPKQHIQFCLDWLDIFNSLNQRRWDRAVTVCFDEFEDLVPEGVGKKIYDIELSLSGIFRKNRKNDITTFLTCHSLEDIHWRIKKKIRWKMYMRGAKQQKTSKIKKNLADLPTGTAIIEGSKFERFQFYDLGKERKIRAVVNCM